MLPVIIQQQQEQLQASHWIFTRQGHVSYQIWKAVSGFLILGNGQSSSQTIFGSLYFPSFYRDSPVSSGYRTQGPLLFESFPRGLKCFLKIHHRDLPSPCALLLFCVAASCLLSWVIPRLGFKMLGYIGDLVRKYNCHRSRTIDVFLSICSFL